MNNPDQIARLPNLDIALLQEDIAPIHSESRLSQEYVWRSSWIERLAMVIAPCLLLALAVNTSGQTKTRYGSCWDERFYATFPAHETPIFLMPRVYLFGFVVSEPAPLVSYNELMKMTKARNASARGLWLNGSKDLIVYPMSLIDQGGLSPNEVSLYSLSIGGVLILWLLLGLWNLGSFAQHRRRIYTYTRYGG